MANLKVGRIRINRTAVVNVIQTGKPRAWFENFGRRLVASIQRFFPRGRRKQGGRDAGRPHAADTITFTIANIPLGLRMSVHTVGVRYGTIIERGGKPSTIRGRGGKPLAFEKKPGEKRVRPVVNHPGSRKTKGPFQRGLEALGLKFRRR